RAAAGIAAMHAGSGSAASDTPPAPRPAPAHRRLCEAAAVSRDLRQLTASCGRRMSGCARSHKTAAVAPLPLDIQKCIAISMTSRELLRKLRRLGPTVDPARGKGGHVQVELRGRKSIVPTGSGEIRRGTLFAILRDLRLRLEDLS